MDIESVIAKIIEDKKLMSSSNITDRIYTDEPIIRTASQMHNFLPDKCRSMRRIATDHSSASKSSKQIFYEQAKLMEKYRDDFSYTGEFKRFYPTYNDMNDNQLRGYFSWRTRVRDGAVEKTSFSFVCVYVYELLHLVGADTPEEGFDMLYSFIEQYKLLDNVIENYSKIWLKDFIVYYGLDKSYLKLIRINDAEEHINTVLNYEEFDDDCLFDSLTFLSSYKPENSSFCKNNLSDFKVIAVSAFKKISDYYSRKRKNSYSEKLFGRIISCGYSIFGSAVFYDINRNLDREYVISDIHSYKCENGKWYCRRYYGNLNYNREIGFLFKVIDGLMREKFLYRHKLKIDKIPEIYKKIICDLIDELFLKKEQAKVPVINIDVSKLGMIRISSDIIRDKLIVEDEKEITAEEVNVQMKDESIEDLFLKALINGEDYSALLKDYNVMLSVLVDSINEKYYEEFCDTVIDFDGDLPVIIDDYADEIKEWFKI